MPLRRTGTASKTVFVTIPVLQRITIGRHGGRSRTPTLCVGYGAALHPGNALTRYTRVISNCAFTPVP
jgi:hypothetical protein